MESSFTTRKDLIKRKASGWYFWGAVVAVAFPGPYGPETGYDPRDNGRVKQGFRYSETTKI